MATAMGNWSPAASSWQRARSCATFCAEFFGKPSHHPGDSAPLQPRFGPVQLLAFLKAKITFERERDFRPRDEIEENTTGQLMAIPTKGFTQCFEQWKRYWNNCVRSQHAYFEVDWGVIVVCNVFVSSSINLSIFHSTWLDTFWTDLLLLTSNVWGFSPIPRILCDISWLFHNLIQL